MQEVRGRITKTSWTDTLFFRQHLIHACDCPPYILRSRHGIDQTTEFVDRHFVVTLHPSFHFFLVILLWGGKFSSVVDRSRIEHRPFQSQSENSFNLQTCRSECTLLCTYSFPLLPNLVKSTQMCSIFISSFKPFSFFKQKIQTNKQTNQTPLMFQILF